MIYLIKNFGIVLKLHMFLGIPGAQMEKYGYGGKCILKHPRLFIHIVDDLGVSGGTLGNKIV